MTLFFCAVVAHFLHARSSDFHLLRLPQAETHSFRILRRNLFPEMRPLCVVSRSEIGESLRHVGPSPNTRVPPGRPEKKSATSSGGRRPERRRRVKQNGRGAVPVAVRLRYGVRPILPSRFCPPARSRVNQLLPLGVLLLAWRRCEGSVIRVAPKAGQERKSGKRRASVHDRAHWPRGARGISARLRWPAGSPRPRELGNRAPSLSPPTIGGRSAPTKRVALRWVVSGQGAARPRGAPSIAAARSFLAPRLSTHADA